MSDLMADLRAALALLNVKGEAACMRADGACANFMCNHGPALLRLLEAGRKCRDELYEDTLLEYGKEAADGAVREYDEAAK